MPYHDKEFQDLNRREEAQKRDTTPQALTPEERDALAWASRAGVSLNGVLTATRLADYIAHLEATIAAKDATIAAKKEWLIELGEKLVARLAEVATKDDRIEALERVALFLWDRLDDIDTLDDACKGDDTAFRKEAYRLQRRRFEVGSVSADGQTVALSGTPAPDALAGRAALQEDK